MRRTWDPTVPAVIAAIVMLAGTLAATGGIGPGEWRATLGSDERSVRLDVRLAEGHSQTRISMDVAGAELAGFDAAAFGRSGAPLRLVWKRDAGSFRFEGVGGRRPGGKVRFEADASFAERWRALGLEPLSGNDALQLAIDDIRLADAEQLSLMGVRLAPGDMARLRSHGVSMNDLRAYQFAGLRPDIEAVIRLNSHGIDARYVKGMIDAGVAKDDLDGIVRLHDQGVDAEYVRGLFASRLPGLDLDDVVRLHAHGVPAEYARAVVEIGPGRRDADDVARLHDHGVSAEFVRSLVQAGRRDLSVDEVIRAESLGPEALGIAAGTPGEIPAPR